MKVGDSVKVHDTRTGGDGKLEWQAGQILEINPPSPFVIVGVGEPHWFNYFKKEYTTDRIRRFERIENPDDAIKAMVSASMLAFKDSLHNALIELLPGVSGAFGDDGTVSLYHGSVTIQPCIMEVRCIGVDREVCGWSVSGWTSYPDTRHEPGGVDENSLGEFRHYGDAIKAAIKAVFERKLNDYYEGLSAQAMEFDVVP